MRMARIAVEVVIAVDDDDEADEGDQAQHRGAERIHVETDADARRAHEGGALRAGHDDDRRRRQGRDQADGRGGSGQQVGHPGTAHAARARDHPDARAGPTGDTRGKARGSVPS